MLGELEETSRSIKRIAHVGGQSSPHSTEECTITLLLQSVNGLVGQSGTSLLEGLEPGIEVDEAELEVQRGGERLENAATGL